MTQFTSGCGSVQDLVSQAAVWSSSPEIFCDGSHSSCVQCAKAFAVDGPDMTCMFALCIGKPRVSKWARGKSLSVSTQTNQFHLLPVLWPHVPEELHPAGRAVSVPSVSMCGAHRQHHMAADSFHPSLPLLNKTYWSLAREHWMEEERERESCASRASICSWWCFFSPHRVSILCLIS